MNNETSTLQLENGIVAIFDAPVISLTEDENAGEGLLKFYTALGWNGEDMLDPCKVRTTKAVYTRLFDLMFEKLPDAVTVGLALVNRGPRVDASIPINKVYLLDSWIKPIEPGGMNA